MRKNHLDSLVESVHNYGLNCTSREIYLHGQYATGEDSEDSLIDYRLAVSTAKNFRILESIGDTNILIHMHLVGGEWVDGVLIFDTIKHSSCPTIILASQASSMGGIVLQSADKRVLTPNAEIMLHHGSLYVDNNSIAAASAVELNNQYCKKMLWILGKRAMEGKWFKDREYNIKKTIIYIDRKIRQKSDWFLDPYEAVDYGFCDGVLGMKGYENMEAVRRARKFKWSDDQ